MAPPAPAGGTPGRSAAGLGSKILFWGGLTLIITTMAAVVGDWASRNYEVNRLLTAIERSEAAMKEAESDILAVTIPVEPTAEQSQQVEEELRAAAVAGRREVVEAAEGVGEVLFLPWHSSLVSAQSAYLAHNRAWEDYLAGGAEDPESLFSGDNMIEPTWRRAEFQVRMAVPPLPWPGIADRVDTIFAEEELPAPGADVAA